MGCVQSSSTVLSEIDTSVAEQESVRWKHLPTELEAQNQYIADGTIGLDVDRGQLEFRALLDYPLAVRYMTSHVASLPYFLETLFNGWLDIQVFNTIPLGAGRSGMALQIQRRYINGNHSIGAKTKIAVAVAIEDVTNIPEGIFDEVQVEIFKILYDRVFLSFKGSSRYRKMIAALHRKYNRVRLNDFTLFNILGQGGHGVVCHVRKRTTGVDYAMKIQSKEHLAMLYSDEPWRAGFEKQAFASCSHPFLVELHFAFQTKTMVMMVMSLGTGQDLSKVLRLNGPLSYERVLFYSAEITSALSYLHHKGFIYRDLKPGNVLLNADGHIQLVDFGAVCDVEGHTVGVCADPNAMLPLFSKQRLCDEDVHILSQYWTGTPVSVGRARTSSWESVQSNRSTHGDTAYSPAPSHTSNNNGDGAIVREMDSEDSSVENRTERALSVVGTYGYMAPEMVAILQRGGFESAGYTKAIDWWSLGVTMYRLLTGRYPFKTNFEEPPASASSTVVYGVAEKRLEALMAPISFAQLATYPESAKDIISGLLTVKDSDRLGFGPSGSMDVSLHPYFASIDWVQLEQKNIRPPEFPSNCRYTPSMQRFANIDDLLYSANKRQWLGAMGDSPHYSSTRSHDSQRLRDIQAQFDNWDYSSPVAVMAELGHS